MHPKNKEQSAALKAIAKAFKIDFKIKEEEISEREKAVNFYGKELIESIERGEEDIKSGRVTRIKDINNVWDSIL